MSNSFYYFFSAVPQVLGGILALFGVFVIFTIQSIKKELNSLAQLLLEDCKKLEKSEIKLASERLTNASVVLDLEKAIQGGNIWAIRLAIQQINFSKFDYYKLAYIKTFRFLESLIKRTINLSKFTAIIIVLCLAIIPLGSWFLCHLTFLYILFSFVLICIIISFIGLVRILNDSLYKNTFSLIPDDIQFPINEYPEYN